MTEQQTPPVEDEPTTPAADEDAAPDETEAADDTSLDTDEPESEGGEA
jgi:hypothetical protein